MTRRRKRVARAVAAAAGVALTAALVWEIGPSALARALGSLAWRFPLLLLPQALVSLLDTAGWRSAFPGRQPRLLPLLGARLAGEAVNETTPTATLGGEPVKAWLVRRLGVPPAEALASVVVAKTALAAAQLPFIALGLGLTLAMPAVRVATPLLGLIAALGLGGVVSVGALVWVQQYGLFRLGGRALALVGVDDAGRMAGLDEALRHFYRRCRGRFAVSCGWHFAGWLAGALEVWLALRLLGAPVDLGAALAIEAFATAIRSAGFLVPAALGVQEGGIVLVVVGFGLGADQALALAVLRRLRQVAWALVGYGVLAAWRVSDRQWWVDTAIKSK